MKKLKRYLQRRYNALFRQKHIRSRIKELSFKEDKTGKQWESTVTVEHPELLVLTAALVESFYALGGVNYVSFIFLDPATLEDFEVVLQKRAGKKTPAELATIYRECLQEAAGWIKTNDQYYGSNVVLMKIQTALAYGPPPPLSPAP